MLLLLSGVGVGAAFDCCSCLLLLLSVVGVGGVAAAVVVAAFAAAVDSCYCSCWFSRRRCRH